MINIIRIIQGLLVFTFCSIGAMKMIQPIEILTEQMNYMNYFQPWMIRSIGFIEFMCGLLLFIPRFIKFIPNQLTFLSGYTLCILMIGAIVTHIMIGETDQGLPALVLLLLSGFITSKKKNELY